MTIHLLCDCVHVCCSWHHINFHTYTHMVALCSELMIWRIKIPRNKCEFALPLSMEHDFYVCLVSVKKLIWWSWRWICERNYLLLHFNGFFTSHFIKGIVLEDCVNCSSQTDWRNQKKTLSVQYLLNSQLMQQMLMKRWEKVIYWYFSLWKLWGCNGHSSERKPLWVNP